MIVFVDVVREDGAAKCYGDVDSRQGTYLFLG